MIGLSNPKLRNRLARLSRLSYIVVAFAVAFVGLNAPFYALLLRRRGPFEAAVGVGLHAVHHLTGAAAFAAAVAARGAATCLGVGARPPCP